MANYTGAARSNYFEVRDEECFLAWVATLPGVVAETKRNKDGEERFALLCADGDCGGWPSFRSRDDGLDDEEIDLPAELSGYLADGSVAVLEEAGSEKLRYVVGYAIAVNHEGEVLSVDIQDIYRLVEDAGWGSDVSRAAY